MSIVGTKLDELREDKRRSKMAALLSTCGGQVKGAWALACTTHFLTFSHVSLTQTSATDLGAVPVMRSAPVLDLSCIWAEEQLLWNPFGC
jgi:hypothetical protein